MQTSLKIESIAKNPEARNRLADGAASWSPGPKDFLTRTRARQKRDVNGHSRELLRAPRPAILKISSLDHWISDRVHLVAISLSKVVRCARRPMFRTWYSPRVLTKRSSSVAGIIALLPKDALTRKLPV